MDTSETEIDPAVQQEIATLKATEPYQNAGHREHDTAMAQLEALYRKGVRPRTPPPAVPAAAAAPTPDPEAEASPSPDEPSGPPPVWRTEAGEPLDEMTSGRIVGLGQAYGVEDRALKQLWQRGEARRGQPLLGDAAAAADLRRAFGPRADAVVADAQHFLTTLHRDERADLEAWADETGMGDDPAFLGVLARAGAEARERRGITEQIGCFAPGSPEFDTAWTALRARYKGAA